MEAVEEGRSSSLSCSYRQVDLDVVCCEVYFCKFCGDFARLPVLNLICGHLFCWCCLYRDVEQKRQKGHRQCCPLCKSHLDISSTTSTIIRVSSGPQPGVLAGLQCVDEIINPEHPGRGKEAEKEIKVKGVPPRPSFQDSSRYSSLCHFMRLFFIRLQSTPLDIEEWCQSLCDEETGDPELFVELIEEEIPKMIEVVQNHLRWLKGEANSGVSRAMHNERSARGQNKRIPSKKAKFKWRPHTRLRLSSQFFYNQLLRKTKGSKQQPLLHQLDDFAPSLESFSCTICSKPAYEPVAIKSGHLFCWTCLRSQTDFYCIRCPVTKVSISAVLGSTHAAPIYYTCNDYEEEDSLLATNRPTKISTNQNCNIDISKLVRRPKPTMLTQFLEYMIFEIKDEGDAILNLLGEIMPNWNSDRQKVEKTCGEIRGRMDALFAWLVTAWRAKCKEQESEPRFGVQQTTNYICKDDYYHRAWDRLVMKMDFRIFAGGKKVDEVLGQILGFRSPGRKSVPENC